MRLIILFYFAFTHHISLSWSFDLKNYKNVYTNIVNEGSSKLVYLGDKIKKHIATLSDVSQIVVNVTQNYTAEIDRLFNVMAKHEVKYELERQYYYLYIVESCNEIFLSTARILLNTISDRLNNYQLDTEEIMEKAGINKVVIDEKKSSLMYICLNLDVCRTFPAFSNHLADLLNEFLKLSSSRFVEITKILKEAIGVKVGFFRNIMNDKIAFQICYELKKVADHPKHMRRLFTVLQEILIKKNKLFKTKDGTISTRIKAVRLLIDILDKAFEAIGEEAIYIEFDNIIGSLKLWAIDERSDMKIILTNSCNYIFDILHFYWDPDTKEEVKLLIEVYVTGTSENSIIYDDLQYKGSKFLRNENLLSAVDFIT